METSAAQISILLSSRTTRREWIKKWLELEGDRELKTQSPIVKPLCLPVPIACSIRTSFLASPDRTNGNHAEIVVPCSKNPACGRSSPRSARFCCGESLSRGRKRWPRIFDVGEDCEGQVCGGCSFGQTIVFTGRFTEPYVLVAHSALRLTSLFLLLQCRVLPFRYRTWPNETV